MIPRAQHIISIFWPSFIIAGFGVMIIFTVIDPKDIISPDWFVQLDRLEAYTVSFLFLWVLTSCACALTCYFQKPEHRVCSS